MHIIYLTNIQHKPLVEACSHPLSLMLIYILAFNQRRMKSTEKHIYLSVKLEYKKRSVFKEEQQLKAARSSLTRFQSYIFIPPHRQQTLRSDSIRFWWPEVKVTVSSILYLTNAWRESHYIWHKDQVN